MTGSQGRPAERWPITVKNTAVIVVDMQNIWVHPRGLRYLPMSEDILPRIQDLLRFCRSKRVPVVYLHTTKRKDLADIGIFADIKNWIRFSHGVRLWLFVFFGQFLGRTKGARIFSYPKNSEIHTFTVYLNNADHPGIA